MEYTRIYHPQLNKFISTKSVLGKNLFKNYITQLQLGGAEKINYNFDVNHMPIKTRLKSPEDADLFNFDKEKTYKLYWNAGGNFEDKILSKDSYVSICPRGLTAPCPSDDGWKLLKFPTSQDIQNNEDLKRIENMLNVDTNFKREEKTVLLNVSDCLSRFYKNEGTAEFYVIGASVKKNLDFLTGKLVDKERDFTYTKPAKIIIGIENWDDYLKNFHALIHNNSFVLNQNKDKIAAAKAKTEEEAARLQANAEAAAAAAAAKIAAVKAKAEEEAARLQAKAEAAAAAAAAKIADAKAKAEKEAARLQAKLKKSLKIVELEDKVKKFDKLANKLSNEPNLTNLGQNQQGVSLSRVGRIPFNKQTHEFTGSLHGQNDQVISKPFDTRHV